MIHNKKSPRKRAFLLLPFLVSGLSSPVTSNEQRATSRASLLEHRRLEIARDADRAAGHHHGLRSELGA
ncbi:MAG: hypothetical protein ACRD3R_11840, partial [Terriglobales bacterium]